MKSNLTFCAFTVLLWFIGFFASYSFPVVEKSITLDDEIESEIPAKKLIGEYSSVLPPGSASYHLTLSDDRTYRLDRVFGVGLNYELFHKTFGTWSVEQSLVVLTPALDDGNRVFGASIILVPAISDEGHVSFTARLHDNNCLNLIGFIGQDMFTNEEEMPNHTTEPLSPSLGGSS